MATTTSDNRDLIHEWITRPLPSLLLSPSTLSVVSDDDPQCHQDADEHRDAAAD